MKNDASDAPGINDDPMAAERYIATHSRVGRELHSVERILTELSAPVRRAWEAIEAEVAERRDNNKAR